MLQMPRFSVAFVDKGTYLHYVQITDVRYKHVTIPWIELIFRKEAAVALGDNFYFADLVLFLLCVAVESPPLELGAAVEPFLAVVALVVTLLKGPIPLMTINIRHQL